MRDDLRGHGYIVVRSAASRSPVDLVAFGRNEVLAVQCKRDGQLPPAEWNELYSMSIQAGVKPLMAERAEKIVQYRLLTGEKDGTRGSRPWLLWVPP